MTNSKIALEDLLIKRFSINKEQVDLLISEVESVVVNTTIQDIQKKSLEEMELHLPASLFIESEVNKYREKLYKFAKEVAQIDSERDIVTKSHAMRAKDMVWNRKTKWDFSDALLTIGGLFLGAGIPHILDLIQKESIKVNITLLILSILGALGLGMGLVLKSKK
jgi:hypothetical protein